MAINPQHEIEAGQLTRDTRSPWDQFTAWLFIPKNFRNALIAFIGLQLYYPAFWPVYLVVLWITLLEFQDQKFVMPLRMPRDIGGLDRSDYIEERKIEKVLWGLASRSRTLRKFLPAAGILYLGYVRALNTVMHGREIWLTNSDSRTHLFLPGATGSGKSEALLGLYYNVLCWSSGCCYGDGKSDSDLAFSFWSLARRRQREDDVLILNFLTGGVDPFKKMVEREEGRHAGKAQLPQSNSMNSLAEGSADFLRQMLSSLLPKASGEGAQWQLKAINMIDALLRILCYKRARGEIDISIGVIRHYLALHNLVQFYLEGRDGRVPEIAWLPIKAYFETALPGFNPNQAHDPTQWDPEVLNQHGYLTGQFAQILGMMMDSYSHIFTDKYPDIDMSDVLLNDRLLVALIPPLEKSPQEAAALGNLYVSAIRLMMAQNLGYMLEGLKRDILDTKASKGTNPSILIMDEITYWFAQSLDAMAAQARGLGFMMVFALQDVQKLKHGEFRGELGALLANTRVKWTLALEDPEDTFDIIQKAGGEAYYSMLAGHEISRGLFTNSFDSQDNIRVESRKRITPRDVKQLNQGEGLVIYKDAVVPSASFWIPDHEKKSSRLAARINRFLQIERPTFKRLPRSAIKLTQADPNGADYVFSYLRRATAPHYPSLDDPILTRLQLVAGHMNSISRFEVSPMERGIVLLEAARSALHQARKAGYTGHLHEGRFIDPDELIPDDDDDELYVEEDDDDLLNQNYTE